MKKYVIDTNVLLSNHQSLSDFSKENEVVIPYKVLDELDNNKERQDSAGMNARSIIRKLDALREKGGKLIEGVRIDDRGGKIRISSHDTDCPLIPDNFDLGSADNQIIATALTEKYNSPEDTKTILVSRDLNVRVKCNSLNINTENYNDLQVIDNSDKLFSGSKEKTVSKEMIDNIYSNRDYQLFPKNLGLDLKPNEFVHLKSPGGHQSAFARNINMDTPMRILNDGKGRSAWNIEPRNREQKYAMDLLHDDEVKLVTLVGQAGTGKTLISLASGLDQVMNSKNYKKLIVSRPVKPVGDDIGYLPGTFEEKMMPWMKPIKDNLEEFTGGPMGLEMCMSNGVIELEAISYIRGRSISDAFIIIDESQNNSKHEIKTILTRVGENSKIVLTGDIKQIDSAYIDETSNGLTHTVEKFKDEEIAGHCTLLNGERSELATIAAEVM